MNTATAVKCHICKTEDKPENMNVIILLDRGEEVKGFAHRVCYDRHRTKEARIMYKYRTREDRKKSFEEWRKTSGY